MGARKDLQNLAVEVQELAESIVQSVEDGDYTFAVGLGSSSHQLCELAPRLAAELEQEEEKQDFGEDAVSGELMEHPVVVEAMLSDSYHYFTHHKPIPNGKGSMIVGYKTDVTAAARAMVSREICGFLTYIRDAYELDLEPLRRNGFAEIPELIAEWREKGRK